MPCNDVNPCQESNPCHDNCGCLNPTSWNCIDSPGTQSNLGVTPSMTGLEVLALINSKVAGIGKVLIDGSDTCPEYLLEKLAPGANISFTQIGSGCTKQIRIDSTTGGEPVDVNVKITSNDTTSGYLYDKIVTGTFLVKDVVTPGADEKLSLDVDIDSIISGDAGNQLVIGDDGGLKTVYTAPDGSETKIIEGVGIDISGTGTTSDPYILSTNPTIQVARTCFDGVWRNINLVDPANANVVVASGQPKYRYRFDGSIEFKGNITYTVNFGAYSSGNRKFTIPMGNIPVNCVILSEQSGTFDLKNINYVDVPQASSDQITQQYGYIIRKSSQNIILEFQSSFTGATSKSVVVSFDGCIQHPNL